MGDKYQGFSEEEFTSSFDKAYEEKRPKFEDHLNIAIVGKVSTGKSSLLNAIFERDRKSPIAPVGAISGKTKEVTAYRLSKQVLIMDSPGLDDIRKENSQVTEEFLKHIDLGVFVVTGSADASQKENFLDLKRNAKSVIVVLNQIDVWDSLKPAAYEEVVAQWKATLGISQIFGACTEGYDPDMRDDAPMKIRGVDEIRTAIFDFLKVQGKEILFAREMARKGKYAAGIIVSALTAVATEAFIPGSAVYITATQVVAITSLYYLYTGEVMSKNHALSLLPTFIGKTLGMSIFLWAKSFLPPTGVVDVAAAGIAAVITFSMLTAVKWMLENDVSLDQKDKLVDAFVQSKSIAKEALKGISWSDLIKNPRRITEVFGRLLGA